VGLVAAVINSWKNQWATVGHSKFVPHKRGNPPLVTDAGVIKKISCIKGSVADKFKSAAVHIVRTGLRNHIVETRGSVPDFRRHHARAGLHFLNGVHVKV